MAGVVPLRAIEQGILRIVGETSGGRSTYRASCLQRDNRQGQGLQAQEELTNIMLITIGFNGSKLWLWAFFGQKPYCRCLGAAHYNRQDFRHSLGRHFLRRLYFESASSPPKMEISAEYQKTGLGLLPISNSLSQLESYSMAARSLHISSTESLLQQAQLPRPTGYPFTLSPKIPSQIQNTSRLTSAYARKG